MLLQTGSTSHLSHRAWAFQERLLAPRTVHFGDHGALWECRTETLSSHLPDGFDNYLEPNSLIRPDDVLWDWKEIVDSYTHAQLTVSSDCLPALAGVARRHYELTKHQYLAGMWREGLIGHLVWAVNSNELEYLGNHKRPDWRAPTWSWASVGGAVDANVFELNEEHESDIFISVLDAWTKAPGPDIFGAVSGGELTLACSALVPCSIVVPDDVRLPHCRSLHGRVEVSLDGSQQGFTILLDCEHHLRSENDASVYLLPVAFGCTLRLTRQDDGNMGLFPLVAGLVLQRIEGSPRGAVCPDGILFLLRECPRARAV
ncbi:HET-domain-containing protein [Apiospora sp. TS-2023a]